MPIVWAEGERLAGRWLLVERLLSRTFEVWRVEDGHAKGVLKAGRGDRGARIEREIQLLKGPEHPNLARLLDTGREGDWIWMVQSDAGQATLAEQWFGGQRPPLTDILDAAIGAARAIEALHARGIHHRDVKPTNVIVDTTRERADRYCLVDFDIGVELGQADHHTATHVDGSLHYLAPEWNSASRRITRATDVWSLGRMVAFGLAGAEGAPWPTHETKQAALCRLSLADPVERSLLRLLSAMQADDPGRRPGATGLRMDLERLRAGHPTEADGPRRSPRRWIGGAALLTASLTMVIWAIVASLRDGDQGSNPPTESPPPAPSPTAPPPMVAEKATPDTPPPTTGGRPLTANGAQEAARATTPSGSRAPAPSPPPADAVPPPGGATSVRTTTTAPAPGAGPSRADTPGDQAAPDAAPVAWVDVAGENVRVHLQAATGEEYVLPRTVPAGAYTAFATFGGGPPIRQAVLPALTDGSRWIFRCDAGLMICTLMRQ